MPHQSGAPFASVRSFPKEQRYRADIFFSPLLLPLLPFLLSHLRKGYYFYSPQTSTVIKSKMAGSYNNVMNTNKVSPTQNPPALQATWVLQFHTSNYAQLRLLKHNPSQSTRKHKAHYLQFRAYKAVEL